MPDGKPSEKLIRLAKRLAECVGTVLPPVAEESREACQQFLAEHLIDPPSEKAFNYAKSIAAAKGLPLPEQAKTDAKALSAWIARHEKDRAVPILRVRTRGDN